MTDAYLWAEEDAPTADIEEWAILMSMAKNADPDGCNAAASYPTIAERAKIDAKTVYRRAKEMERRGLLKRGDQSVVEYIRADNRPVVWDLQIPYSWFPNIDRINQWRRQHGKGPLTPAERPDLAPAPPKKRRADAGKPRAKKSAPSGGTSSPVAGGLAVQPSESGETDETQGLVVPPDYESSREGTSSPTTSLGSLVSSVDVRLPSPPNPQPAADVRETPPAVNRRQTPAGRKNISSETENQEGRIVIPRDFWPELTEWEQQLHAKCMTIRPEWRGTVLRKVLGMPQIRERTATNPDLVWRAFIIGANCRKKGQDQGTASPKRLLYDLCPHWAQAAEQLRAKEAADASADQPADPAGAPDDVSGYDESDDESDDPRVPEQRPAAEALTPAQRDGQGRIKTPAYRAWQEQHRARQEAKAAALEAEENERRRRREEAMKEAGVELPIGVGAR